jgi:hypothetical protein
MKFIFILFLIISCGKIIKEESSFPENDASTFETETFDKALATIQEDFNQANIKVKLRSIPYSITNLGDTAGICYKTNSESVGIALDHSLFEVMTEDEDDYGLLYKVLLHEIGHCFFNRDHDEAYYKINGYDMLIEIYPDEGPIRRDSFQQSLMSVLGYFQVPKTLWPYYVKEIAQKARITTWEDIAEYAEVTLIQQSY